MKDNFFDRKIYLDILEKRIRSLKDGYRQNIAIIGDELVGKTSFVLKFLNKFYDNQIIILYLQIIPETLASFSRRFIGVLLYNFLANSGIPLEEDLDFLIKKAAKYIPKTTEKIKSILAALDKRKKDNVFVELLSLCEEIFQETNKFCVVIMDEFHNLENFGIKNLYHDWSKILILQKNTLYIIISSLKFKARNILSKNLSLLFGNFEIVNVEPFDIKTSEEYLEYKLQGFNLSKGLKNFIIHFTGGYPFYLEIIAEAILKSNQTNLVEILENLLFMPAGILNQRFSNYLKRFLDSPQRQDYISILHLISSGHNKLRDIAHILHRQRKEIILRINHLLELDTITRSGDFLKINDRVFASWLKFAYQEKLHSLTFDVKNKNALFRENIEAMIKEFLADAQKPVVERMLELLRLFQDEVIQIEKKRLRLNHFKEIKPLEFNCQSLKEGIIGRSSESLWIMALKYEPLTEEDIAEFAKECRKYRHKLQRKIIIAFQDVDTNSRLRALEEKIWTWDINNLNQVLDLFSKPRIII
jgi:GTPase SAR1 family protein